MKRKLLVFVFLFQAFAIFSQVSNRIEVSGKIVVDSDDLEGVTVYNSSANKGTITNEKGEFVIEVALNDHIEFGALQFKDFTVIIDEKIIDSKQMTVFLVEDVNKLDEVVILPYDLTGNLAVDLESVKTFNPNMEAIHFGIKHSSAYEFSDDIRSNVENIAMHSQGQTMVNGLNVINLVGLLLKPLFRSNKSKEGKAKNASVNIPINTLTTYYSELFLNENFGIPINRFEEFITYVEANNLDYSLLETGKELQFLEHLTLQSKQFLKPKSEKD
ncbi:carboxypeptidase-like regulatory domain-containing protein [Ichthyenterobacterium magnum]|uniref:Carboxypeptidase-like protein n=1 Tax=Ichthyenterobacterium magnum TaxID=1230530 RepID=A0A420DVP9_9FLAO|nr:carboxypeptidase-like regulatory domain-containing protein [Ichthyenterobacterium magnum]RKE98299.1 carboxypeptidase-like protein [Ichthyenterobacterium magnum]